MYYIRLTLTKQGRSNQNSSINETIIIYYNYNYYRIIICVAH